MPRPWAWKPFILIASYVFYASAGWRFCLLLAGMTLVNQTAAVLLHRSEDERRRRLIVATAVAIDLGTLGVFKYYSFFAQQWADLLNGVGLGLPLPLLTIALPVGISFFTFQAISYVVDVARRQVQPAGMLDFAVYLSFFPHLVAGSDRAGPRVPAPARQAPRPQSCRGRLGAVADRAGRDQEGRDRRLSRPRAGRTGVRRAAGVQCPGCVAGGLRVHRADLLRLLRLHRHRDRPGAAARATCSRRTFAAPTGRPAFAISGDAGT